MTDEPAKSAGWLFILAAVLFCEGTAGLASWLMDFDDWEWWRILVGGFIIAVPALIIGGAVERWYVDRREDKEQKDSETDTR